MAATSGPKTREQKRAEADARNASYQATRERKQRLDVVETQLAEAQNRYGALVDLMAEPGFYADREAFEAALAEYTHLKRTIPGLEEEWLTLTEEIETLVGDDN